MSADDPRPIRIPKKKPASKPASPVSSAPAARKTPGPAPQRVSRAKAAPQTSTKTSAPKPAQPANLAKEPTSRVRQPQESPIAAGTISAEPQATDLTWLESIRDSLWTMPAWTLSLLLHVVVLLALALVTVVVIESKPEVVISTSISDEHEPMEEFNEIEIEEPEELIEEEPLFAPDLPEMPKLTFDAAALAASDAAVDGEPTDSAANPGPSASMADTAGSPRTGSETGKAVTFYGSKSSGNRFVFLIDNSPNMNNEGRMLMAMDQLLRAVHQMSAKQSFFVVFYSNRPYPLFFPDSADDMVDATRKNKQKLEQWLTTVELCDSRPGGSQAIQDMLQLARRVTPSTIFFLTDGDYARTVARELEDSSLPAPLNVIGLMPSKVTNQSERDAMEKLQEFARLAEKNNGAFTGVPSSSNFPADTFVERNRDQPGSIWGIYQND